MSKPLSENGLPSAFIWYHADVQLSAQLSRWVQKISRDMGLEGRLLVRNEGDKTTFMEIYSGAGKTIMAEIEKRAATQSWFTRLASPRRVEIFSEIKD